MWFLTSIINWLVNAGDYLYSAYSTVEGWVYPFSSLSTPLYYLYLTFHNLSYYFGQFDTWLVAVSQRLTEILDWPTIRSYIRSWLPNLDTIINWFSIRLQWLRQELGSWWLSIQPTIRYWIDIAVQGFDTLKVAWSNFITTIYPQLVSLFNDLKAHWDYFWTITFPNLVSFNWLGIWWEDRLRDIRDFLDSRILEWFPFYDDLVELLTEIKSFFTDPIEWLGNKIMDWLEENW